MITNTISYGYPDAAQREIALELAHTPQDVRVTLQDDARPFDPLSAPPPDLE